MQINTLFITDGLKRQNTIDASKNMITCNAVYGLEKFPLTRFIVNVGFDTITAHSTVSISDIVTFLKQKQYIKTKSLTTGFDGVHLILNFINSSSSQWFFDGIGLRCAWIEFEGAFIDLDSTNAEERWIMKIHTVETRAEYIAFKLPNATPVVLKTALTSI